MNWDIDFLPYAMFVAVSGLVLIPLYVMNCQDKRVKSRIDELSNSAGAAKVSPAMSLRSRWETLVARLAAPFLPDEQSERSRIETRLLHAGFRRTIHLYTFVSVRLVLMAVPFVVTIMAGVLQFIPMEKAILYGAGGGALGIVLPGLWLDHRTSRRQTALSRSLPDFLDLLVTCVESGMSFDGALRRVTAELAFAHPLLGNEIKQVEGEIDLGNSPDTAILSFAERSGLDSVRTLGAFMQQSRSFGTSIVEALRAHSDMLRAQREQRAEEMAQKAALKILFPTLLFIFPAVFVVLAGPAAIQLQEKFSN